MYRKWRINIVSEQLNMEQFFGDKINSFGEPHLACALLLDTSASMGTGNRAIDSLNAGVQRFKASVMSDPIAQKRVDVALITFNTNVEVISDFVPVSQMPTPILEADGMTDMAAGIQTAIDLVKQRTAMYQTLGTPCHKPWIFMITDGASTSDEEDMRKAAERISIEEGKGSHGRLAFWALGIDNYDQAELFKLTNRVLELRNEDFTGIFDWLSESMSCISQSHIGESVKFDPLPENARKAEKDRAIDSDWY